MHADALKERYEPQPGGMEIEYGRQLWQARFSPCGRFLFACGYDATVQRWDVSGETAGQLAPFAGHNGWVQCLGFDRPGRRLLTADSWGQLACRSYGDGPSPTLWQHEQAHDGWIRALAVSSDGKWVATGGNDAVVRIWSTPDGTLRYELPHPERIYSLAFHPDGNSLVSGDLKAVVRQWDLAGVLEAKAPGAGGKPDALQPGSHVKNGRSVADYIIREFDAGSLYQLHRIQECGGARHLSFDAEGRFLACAGQKNPQGGFARGEPCVLVFDWKTGKRVREMSVGGSQDGFAYDARFHPDGFVMATSCAFPGKGHLWFWRPQDEKAFYTSQQITNGRSLSLHPDGRRLAMMVSSSRNGNGRQLKDGEYVGGTAKIHILEMPENS